MATLESESSLPQPGISQRTFQSSPPPVERSSSVKVVDNAGHTHQSNPTATDMDEDKRLPIVRTVSSETEQPPSAQRVNPELNAPENDDVGDEAESEIDPAEQIADFNWEELHERYHDAINGASEKEAELMREWEELMAYFRIWAEAGHSHETERTFLRLRTRMAYVGNSESTLEKTRQHYVSVVKAFESALALLKDSGIPG